MEELEVATLPVEAVELGRAEDVAELHGDVEEALLGAARQGDVEGDGDVGVGDAGELAATGPFASDSDVSARRMVFTPVAASQVPT
jgi:hypothetical protein